MGIMKPVFSSVFGPIIPDVNWTPNSLFALAEPGVWYDPSDLTTMFQDREGTTPVTASGQFVGLRLDNSKGLVLGSELVTNGNNEVALYSGAGAIGGSIARGAAPGGGFAAVFTCNSGFLSCQALYQTIAANTPIKISVRVYVPTGSLNAIQLFDANDGSWKTSTTSTKDSWVTLTAIRAAKATPWILGIGQIAGQLLAGQVFYVDDLSVKQLPGNHAVAIDDAARGIYGVEPFGGRRNILEQTNDFTVSPWAATVLGTSTRANTSSPYNFGLGLVTVTSTNGGIRQSRTGLTSGQPYALSFYLESAAANINVVFENGTADFGSPHAASINPSTGAFSSVSGFTSTTSVVLGTGRIYTLVSAAAGGNLIANIEWRVTAASGSFLLGRPQFELGSTATAYQRVTTQYDVTETGKQTLHYVQYNNDGYVTPTITPGIDKVQVFAGVRKLSDAAQGMLVELSASLGANNGTFALSAPVSSSNSYRLQSKGTADVLAETGSQYPAPITNVVAGLGDISGDAATLRVNGTQAAQSTSDQGAGNYLAYPLYIGRRGGTLIPFNGRDYGIVVRFGPNLGATTIESAEDWIAKKTGVSL